MEDNKIKISLKTLVILIIIAVIIVISIVVLLNKSENNIKENDTTQVEDKKIASKQSNENFAFEFLKIENEIENIVYSPLSIKYALQMLNEGAEGNTKAQIENVIKDINLVKYNNIDNIMSLANAMYIKDSYSEKVKEDYKNTLLKKYNADVKYDSFENASNINNWIENKTLGKIKNMLSDDVVVNNKILLINALAIDMEWEDSFEMDETNGETFYLNDGSSMNATMMHKKVSSDDISYYKDKNLTSLIMDLKEYNDTQLEFIAVMPNENLSNYIENFTVNQLNDITSNSKLASKTKYGVDISIPKFSFDFNLKLKEDLIKLGITDAFDENLADFSNIENSDTELYVNDALHKADIEFTEKGIKAAATTVIAIVDSMAMLDIYEPEKINIDKPFLYVIRDKNTKEIWFVGTVYEPNNWENDKEDYVK